MKLSIPIFLLLFPLYLYTADNTVKYYKKLNILYNFKLEPLDEAEESIKGKSPYFLVTSYDNFPTKIQYFDKWGNPAHYKIDDLYHLYFSTANINYQPNSGKPQYRVQRADLLDYRGLSVGYIKYNWDNKKIYGQSGTLRSIDVFTYKSDVPTGFIHKEKRSFIFGGGGNAFNDNIQAVKNIGLAENNDLESKKYQDGKLVSYERWGIDNEKIFTDKYEYSLGKLKTKVVYNKRGVRLN